MVSYGSSEPSKSTIASIPVFSRLSGWVNGRCGFLSRMRESTESGWRGAWLDASAPSTTPDACRDAVAWPWLALATEKCCRPATLSWLGSEMSAIAGESKIAEEGQRKMVSCKDARRLATLSLTAAVLTMSGLRWLKQAKQFLRSIPRGFYALL